MRLLVVDLATGRTRPLAPDVPRGTGAPDFAVSRDGKSALITLELGEFTCVVAVPTHGRGPARTLFTTTHEVWSLDTAPDGKRVFLCDGPARRTGEPSAGSRSARNMGSVSGGLRSGLACRPAGWAGGPDSPVSGSPPRLMVVEQGKSRLPWSPPRRKLRHPLRSQAHARSRLLIGPVPRATIAFADVETGRITRRIAPGKGKIVSLAASPDGGTLYFATGGTIWSIPSAGGQARKIRAGDRVVADPSGRTLLVTILESPNMRLFRVPLDGSPETEIAADASHAPRYSHLSPGSWNADGRLLVSLTRRGLPRRPCWIPGTATCNPCRSIKPAITLTWPGCRMDAWVALRIRCAPRYGDSFRRKNKRRHFWREICFPLRPVKSAGKNHAFPVPCERRVISSKAASLPGTGRRSMRRLSLRTPACR